jgi:transposase
MVRRKFTREFKLEAVRLIQEQIVPVSQVCRDMELHESVVRRWMREADRAGGEVFPGHGQMKPRDAELSKLQRELRRVTAERDILKKALGYFAKEPA